MGQEVFSNRGVIDEVATVQTWMFAGEQCDKARSRWEWKAAMSSRGTDEGSGRKRPAEKAAFAMAI